MTKLVQERKRKHVGLERIFGGRILVDYSEKKRKDLFMYSYSV